MFSKLHITLAIALGALMAVPALAQNGTDQCNNGSIQCCNTTYASGSHEADVLLHAAGVDKASAPEGLVAAGCGGGGVSVGGGSDCQNTPICCQDNLFGGLLGIGCSPISIGL